MDGEVKSGIIVVECPDGEGKVDLEIMEASSTVTPEIKDGNISIKIEIKEQSNLGSQSCAENLATSEILKLGEKNASAIRNEITASISRPMERTREQMG